MHTKDLKYARTLLHIYHYYFVFIGLYLYLLVVKTFTGDNIKLRLCLVIGWGEWKRAGKIRVIKSTGRKIERNDN